MVRITLDAETFKALASPSRLLVLRALDERRKTLTELARDMALNKATVHEHLQLLTAADLIRKRDDEGRKWIYYELTWRGQKLLHPQESTTFNILLGAAVASAGGGMAMLGRTLGWWLQDKAQQIELAGGGAAPLDKAQPASQQDTSTATGTAAQPQAGLANSATSAPTSEVEPHTFFDDGGWFVVGLAVVAIIAGLAAWWIRRRLAARPFTPPEGMAPGS